MLQWPKPKKKSQLNTRSKLIRWVYWLKRHRRGLALAHTCNCRSKTHTCTCCKSPSDLCPSAAVPRSFLRHSIVAALTMIQPKLPMRPYARPRRRMRWQCSYDWRSESEQATGELSSRTASAAATQRRSAWWTGTGWMMLYFDSLAKAFHVNAPAWSWMSSFVHASCEKGMEEVGVSHLFACTSSKTS